MEHSNLLSNFIKRNNGAPYRVACDIIDNTGRLYYMGAAKTIPY